jgi:hypothetical protein
MTGTATERSRPAGGPVVSTLRRHSFRIASLPERPAEPAVSVPAWVLVTAALPPVLTAAGWLIADALQPASYSPVRQTMSVLAGHTGTDRWIMTGALFLVGGCYLATAAGLSGVRVPARVVLTVAGLSSIGIALCPEPAGGTSPQHLAWTALGAVAITAWPAFAAWGLVSPPAILSRQATVVVTAGFLCVLIWLVIQTQGGSALGLAERTTSEIQTSWPFVVAVALRGGLVRRRPGQLSDRMSLSSSSTTCIAASSAPAAPPSIPTSRATRSGSSSA